MIFNIFKNRAQRKASMTLYAAISEASRAPYLYTDCAVPDTPEGRFESLGLHLSLVLRRLKELPAPALDISKNLVDHFFEELDGALRTLGVSDVSVGKKIKPLAQAFYGRAKALDEALQNQQTLTDVLSRNVLETADSQLAQKLADYVHESIDFLAMQSLEKLLLNNTPFQKRNNS